MTFIKSSDRCFQRSDLMLRIAKAATGFETLGITAGDGVAMILRNDIAFFEAGQASGMIGAYPVAINWHATPEEARYILNDCGASVLVIHADLLARIEQVIPPLMVVLVVPTPEELCTAYNVPENLARVPRECANWNDWVERFEPRRTSSETAPNTIIYTSGTTGQPKGVRREKNTPQSLEVAANVLARCYGFSVGVTSPSEVVTAVVGPIYHAAPNSHANYAFASSANIVMFPRFDGEELLAAVEAYRISHLLMVPIMFARLLKLPEATRSQYDLSSLKFISHAAAPCPAPIKRAMIDWLGPIIYEYYGSTEMGNVTFCSSQEWLAHPGTVGRVIPEAEVRVVDEHGVSLPPRGIGEVIGRTHGIPEFTYEGDEEKRRRTEKFGLITPGDIGYFDEDGFLYLCDRANDMIISGGVNIYPAEIEAELHKLPQVADCAVFGIPDEEFGESVCAVLQLQDATTLDEAEVRTFLRERVSSYKIPRTISFADKLPREDSGKIFKRKLREPYWVGHGRAI